MAAPERDRQAEDFRIAYGMGAYWPSSGRFTIRIDQALGTVGVCASLETPHGMRDGLQDHPEEL